MYIQKKYCNFAKFLIMTNSKNRKKQYKPRKTYTKRNIILGILASLAFIYAYVINYIHADGYDIVGRYISSQANLDILHVNMLALCTLVYSKASQVSRINARTYIWCVAGIVVVVNMFTHALCMNFENLNYLYKDYFRAGWVDGAFLVLLFVIIIRMYCLPEEDEYKKEIIK